MHPDLPEAHTLRGWWDTNGHTAPITHISVSTRDGGAVGNARFMHFADIEQEPVGLGGQPDAFTVRCMISHVKTDQRTLWYIACPECKKKVSGADEMNLNGHCEKCGKAVTGQRRWIFSAQCNDISGSRYVSFFDETATKMLGGASADSMAPLKAENQAAFEQHFLKNAFKTVTMKCLAKSEVYNEESRLKISCQAFQPLDFRQEGRKLLGEIAQMGISGLSI